MWQAFPVYNGFFTEFINYSIGQKVSFRCYWIKDLIKEDMLGKAYCHSHINAA